MAVYCPFMSTRGGAFDVECTTDCMFYGDGTQGSCKLIAANETVPVSNTYFSGMATSAKQDTIINSIGYTGVSTDTLKDDLTAQIIKILKSLGFGNTDLSFGRVSDSDDLKGNIGFNPPSGSLDANLKAWLNGIIGASTDRDTGDVSLYSYLKNVVGENSDLDSTNSLIAYLKNIVGTDSDKDNSNSLLKFLQDIIGIHDDKDSSDQTLLLLEKHIHDSHEHADAHAVGDVPADPGEPTTTAGEPIKAGTLIQEFMGNEDKDGNGAVYGFDFMISSDDDEKPPMLTSLESNPSWEEPDCSITWAEYLAWVAGGPSPC